MIIIKKLKKTWTNASSKKLIFDDFSLQIDQGDFISIIGKNGTGKTTLLNIIAALDKDYSGSVTINDKEKYRTGYVFQNYRQSLFPWLSAFKNIAYPLFLEGKSPKHCKEIVNKLCKEFNVKIDLKKYPYELSGGQQQMVCILRALIFKPDVLLLDEPFSAVDYESTLILLDLLQEVWIKTGITILFISHDLDEALTLSKRIIVLDDRPDNKIKNNFVNPEPYPRTLAVMTKPHIIKLKESILEHFLNNKN